MSMNNLSPLIFVWLGKKIPQWSLETFKFARKNNASREIILLHNNFQNLKYEKLFLKLSINLIQIKINLNQSEILNSKSLIEGSFWKLSSLRFEVLSDFIISRKINSFFHAEIDNLIFNINSLENKLNKVGNGIFAPRDDYDRALGSFFYCNDNSSIKEIIKLYKPPYKVLNDMHALGLYSQLNSKFFSLPTESFENNKLLWDIINPLSLGGIFDAAAIGQYLLGVDPNNVKYEPTYNLFENEKAKIDFNQLDFSTDGIDIYIKPSINNDFYKLYNLHVHSKNIKRAIKLLNKSKIYSFAKVKKKIIVARRYKIILGLPLKFYDFLIRILKNNIKIILNVFFVKNKK